MSKRQYMLAVSVYFLCVIAVLYVGPIRTGFIDFVASVFWYRENYFLYLYLFVPLLMIAPVRNAATRCVFVASTTLLLVLVLVNQYIQLLYSSPGVREYLFALVSVGVVVGLVWTMHGKLASSKCTRYILASVVGATFSAATIATHLLDSIPRADLGG